VLLIVLTLRRLGGETSEAIFESDSEHRGRISTSLAVHGDASVPLSDPSTFIENVAFRKIRGFSGKIDENDEYYTPIYAGNASPTASITALATFLRTLSLPRSWNSRRRTTSLISVSSLAIRSLATRCVPFETALLCARDQLSIAALSMHFVTLHISRRGSLHNHSKSQGR
jgi:hypothetical protein